MSKQVNQRDAAHYIETRQEFTASALSGKMEEFTPQFGRLDNEEVTRLIDAFNLGTRAYVVYSYGTPIAWHTSQGWYIVGQKFSMTTSKHQNAVRRAISSELVGAN
jgi:hypothetical protein